MFWFNRKKKKKEDEFPFEEDEFFEEVEREMRRMMRIMQKMFEDLEKTPPGRPVMKGIRIVIGPDGVPRVEEFGNVKAERGKPRVSDYREPLVDVMERNGKIIVTAELPGVEKKDIKIRADGDKLTIEARGEGPFKYRKIVHLPYRVNTENAKATFKNGILEVILEKDKKETAGKEIKVE